jgi:hypothetical protein
LVTSTGGERTTMRVAPWPPRAVEGTVEVEVEVDVELKGSTPVGGTCGAAGTVVAVNVVVVVAGAVAAIVVMVTGGGMIDPC